MWASSARTSTSPATSASFQTTTKVRHLENPRLKSYRLSLGFPGNHSLLTKAPGERFVLAGRFAVCGFWDMWPAF